MNEVLTVYRKFAEFQGRSGRREYWIYFLFYVVACAVLAIIDNMIFGGADRFQGGAGWSSAGFQPLTSIFGVVSLVPGIAVTVRRLHDTGKSGWWALVGLIPLIGWIWLLVLCAAKGEPGANAYGHSLEAGV